MLLSAIRKAHGASAQDTPSAATAMKAVFGRGGAAIGVGPGTGIGRDDQCGWRGADRRCASQRADQAVLLGRRHHRGQYRHGYRRLSGGQSGADTIVLPKGSTQTLTAANNTNSFYGIGGDNGLPVVTSAITIESNGATIKRAGTAPEFRIFAVDDGAKLTLKRTKVTGGKVSKGAGGGVVNGGTFILSSSTISGNSASGYNGGGLFNAGGSSVTITNNTVSGNSTDGSGGGIATDGALTVTNSTIFANTAARYGGGVNINGDVSIIHQQYHCRQFRLSRRRRHVSKPSSLW